MKVFVISTLGTEPVEEFLKTTEHEVFIAREPKSLEQIDHITEPGEKILVIDPDFVDWALSDDVIKQIPDIKAMVISTTSFSWIESKTLDEKDIPIINVQNYSTDSVAEYALMMALMTARRIPLLSREGYSEDYTKFQGQQFKGKTVGIIGLGNIGKAIAANCAGLGMKVQYWSKNSKDAKYEFKELAELFETSDLIFPTLAQNEETKNLITDDMIKSMKPTSMFVSIVHNIYNHELLLERAKSGELFGYAFEDSKAGLDLFPGNVLVMPTYAWCTDIAAANNDRIWVDNLKKALEGVFEMRAN